MFARRSLFDVIARPIATPYRIIYHHTIKYVFNINDHASWCINHHLQPLPLSHTTHHTHDHNNIGLCHFHILTQHRFMNRCRCVVHNNSRDFSPKKQFTHVLHILLGFRWFICLLTSIASMWPLIWADATQKLKPSHLTMAYGCNNSRSSNQVQELWW